MLRGIWTVTCAALCLLGLREIDKTEKKSEAKGRLDERRESGKRKRKKGAAAPKVEDPLPGKVERIEDHAKRGGGRA